MPLFRRNQAESILHLLRSSRPADRRKALDQLGSIGKTDAPPSTKNHLLRAIEGPFPDVAPSIQSASEAILQALAAQPSGIDVGAAAELYPRLPDPARAWVLRLLAAAGTPSALDHLAQLLRRAELLPAATWPVLKPLEAGCPEPDELVPAFVAAHTRQFANTSASALLAYARRQRLGEARLQVADLAAAAVSQHLDLLSTAVDDDAREEARSRAGLYLDLLAHTEAPSAVVVLADAAANEEPWIALWGNVGLARLGRSVAPTDLERIAAELSCRSVLYDILSSIDRRDLFPRQFADQASLAAGEMARWLAYPTELGAVPDHLELVTTVELPTADGPSDLFVFRFRMELPHWGAKDGWMIGAAGPFRRAQQPTTEALGYTFSRFESEASMGLDEHVKALVGTIDEWRAAQGLDR